MFTISHDIFHLLPFADEISLTNPLEVPLEVHECFQYTYPREAGLLMLVAEADGFVFDAPRCRKDKKTWHRVEILSDADDQELGCLFRVDEEEYDCGCPQILYRPDEDHRRCIRRAWLYLGDRFGPAETPKDLTPSGSNEGRSEVTPTVLSQVEVQTSEAIAPTLSPPPQSSPNTSIASKKRARTDSDAEEPTPKKPRTSGSVYAGKTVTRVIIDLTQDDSD
ncbi:hypothetical protein K435DRAFT_807068 [Dendrothele bispora CBS 962.96]|uniref:Uncharacterized protein n=1 Tax=Dendrothele bispora (strain CBS 962.96) TaxID=1314807 RepID=A0A4S8L6H8_DENBC|nr:hypothetical protein K435DRAFT_807068 [Dendrothele bispora CBS 962.96]